jgi:hypothetical protein
MSIVKSVVRLSVLAGFLVLVARAQPPIPPGLRSYLQEKGFSADEIASVAGGNGVAKLLPASQEDQMGMVGAVFINVAPEYLASAYAQVDKIEPIAALQHGLFSTPAKISDLAALTLESDDVKSLRKCKPGDCDLMLPDSAIARFQKEINWNSSSASDDANRLFRQVLVDYVNAYRAQGDSAMMTFRSGKNQQSTEEGFKLLLAASPVIAQRFPELSSHLASYPSGRTTATKDYILWMKTDTGLKPTIRVAHLMVHTETAGAKKVPVFAIKSLYADYYLRDSLALRVLVPTSDGDAKSAYLVALAHGHTEGLGGFKGRLIRSTLMNSMQKEMADYLNQMKQVVEQWNRQYSGK